MTNCKCRPPTPTPTPITISVSFTIVKIPFDFPNGNSILSRLTCDQVNEIVAGCNRIWKKAGISLNLNNCDTEHYFGPDDPLQFVEELDEPAEGDLNSFKIEDLFARHTIRDNSVQLNVYVVPFINSEVAGSQITIREPDDPLNQAKTEYYILLDEWNVEEAKYVQINHLANVLAHEFGHYLGLPHTDEPNNLMLPTSEEGIPLEVINTEQIRISREQAVNRVPFVRSYTRSNIDPIITVIN